MAGQAANDTMTQALTQLVGTPPQLEYKFHPARKWRFDFAWPEHKIALEVEGGIWIQGRHVRAQGYINDIEKYNAAILLGWRVFRAAPEQITQVALTIRTLLVIEAHNGN